LRRQSIIDVRKQTTEISTLQRRLELLTRKEARITQLCRNHEEDKKDENYQKFFDSVKAVATSGGKFKKTVNMITSDNKDDLMSVYSFEYDPSNMKYTTGAAEINKGLEAPIEEGEEIDEDLDSPIQTTLSKPAAAPPTSNGAPPSRKNSKSSKTSSKACTIM